MTWNSTPPQLPTTLTGKFASITRLLNDAVLGCSMPGGFLTHAMWSLLNEWVFKHVVRIRVLIEALQAGTVRTRRSPPAGLKRQPAARVRRAFFPSRGFAWLSSMMRGQPVPNSWLETLLADPEMIGLLTASPRLVRTMRPFCRALGVAMPRLPHPPVPAIGPEGGAVCAVAGPETQDGSGSVAPGSVKAAAGDGVGVRGVARFAGGDARFRS